MGWFMIEFRGFNWLIVKELMDNLFLVIIKSYSGYFGI